MKRFLASSLAIVVGLLSGCKIELAPVETGYTRQGWLTLRSADKTELTSAQVNAFTTWIKSLKNGWDHEITDTPPGRMILLTHKAGKPTVINVRGGVIWLGNYRRSLSQKEHAELEAILGSPFLPAPTEK